MQLDCPHCGSRIVLSLSGHDSGLVTDARKRLLGSDHVCRECENELGVYYY